MRTVLTTAIMKQGMWYHISDAALDLPVEAKQHLRVTQANERTNRLVAVRGLWDVLCFTLMLINSFQLFPCFLILLPFLKEGLCPQFQTKLINKH